MNTNIAQMPQKSFKQREIFIVMGRTGQGKSMWTRIAMKQKKRIFVFDPLREFRANYVTPETLIRLHDEGLLSKDHNCRVGIAEADHVELLSSLAFLHGDCWLVIEEGAFLFQNGARAPQWLRDPIFLGRHRQLSILITAQRPTSIPIDLRSQASRVVCFSQHEKNDIGWLDSYFGERSDEIAELPPLVCLDATSAGVSKYSVHPQHDDKQQEIEEDRTGILPTI